MKRTAILIGLLALAVLAAWFLYGPSRNEHLAACERSAYRAFPADVSVYITNYPESEDVPKGDAVANDIRLCMEAAGYEFDDTPKECDFDSSGLWGATRQAACYRRVTWLGRLLGR